MYHRLTVHVYQPLGDIFELSEAKISGCRGQAPEAEPYKLKPIHILVSLDKLVDVPIYRPLRCHREVATIHCHPQQR